MQSEQEVQPTHAFLIRIMFYQCSPTYGKVHHEYKHTEQENIAGITIPIQNMEQVSNKNAM